MSVQHAPVPPAGRARSISPRDPFPADPSTKDTKSTKEGADEDVPELDDEPSVFFRLLVFTFLILFWVAVAFLLFAGLASCIDGGAR